MSFYFFELQLSTMSNKPLNMKYFSLLFILTIMYACNSIPQASSAFDPIVLKTKETSLYTANVDWEEVNTTFIKLKNDNLNAALQYLINSLGDKHAVVRSSKDYSIVVSYTGKVADRDPREKDATFLHEVINDIKTQFTYDYLSDNIGYLKVVGIGPGDVKQQADKIRAGLVELKSKGVDKWILDLRYNGGGNIEPMVSGLAPLLGEGYIGGSADANGKTHRIYTIQNGQFDNWGRIACPMNNLPVIALSEKVAILTSRYTVSSGEMLAICFKGRDNTTFIGEQTGGYTTGNGFDQINDELALVISQDVFMDRDSNIYEKWVEVDHLMPFNHLSPPGKDDQRTFAIQWLLK